MLRTVLLVENFVAERLYHSVTPKRLQLNHSNKYETEDPKQS